jgi:hypothetical protein
MCDVQQKPAIGPRSLNKTTHALMSSVGIANGYILRLDTSVVCSQKASLDKASLCRSWNVCTVGTRDVIVCRAWKLCDDINNRIA